MASETAWALHCGGLTGCGPNDPVVREVAAVFAQVLCAPLIPPPRTDAGAALYPHGLELDLATLPDAARSLLLELPCTVIPLLEYHAAVRAGPPTVVALRIAAWDGLSPVGYDTLGTALLGRLVCIEGTVVRASTPRPRCVEMPFSCGACHSVVKVRVDKTVEFPAACATPRCPGKSFVPLTDTALCRDVQVLRLQEPPLAAERHSAHPGVARMVHVEVTGGLLDTLFAGDTAVVCGVLVAQPGDKRSGNAHQLCVEARGVATTRCSATAESTAPHGQMVRHRFSDAEHAAMAELAGQPDFFDQLVSSVCPAIHGHEDTKAALVLALLGGTPNAHCRSNLHVAIFGDPGMGKSQLLRALCNCCPRSVFVAANTASSCGLTLTVSRDGDSGTTVEAGAVVHGDGGVTCIDELDKGSSEHKALLEVMEQEALSLAKAGMVFTLPIRTTVVAAGNPIGGRYNPGRRVAENLNLSPALLSRFDFVFVLSDEAAGDTRLTHHVLQMHSGRPQVGTRGAALTQGMVSAFTQYARTQCHPSMTAEAQAILREAYLAARAAAEKDTSGCDLPVTPRYLQALLRAAQARAKAALREHVRSDDARFAVDLMGRSRTSRQPHRPAAGLAAPPMTGGGRGGKLSLREQVMERLRAAAAVSGGDQFTFQEIIEACEAVGCKNPPAMVDQLNGFGSLLQGPGGKYRLKRQL